MGYDGKEPQKGEIMSKKNESKQKHDSWPAIASRFTLGTILLLAGLDTFIQFPALNFISERGIKGLGELYNSPLFYTFKVVEVIIALMFIGNFLVQTALVMSVPIISSVVIYNLWFQLPEGLFSLVLLIPLSYLFYFYRSTFYLFFKLQLAANHQMEFSPEIEVVESSDSDADAEPRKIRVLIKERHGH